jgi:hypothetical protein
MSLHVSRGSAAPLAAIVHFPTEPASAQLRHAPVQGVLQQTPSTQLPFWQSALAAHFCPSTFAPQLPVATTQAIPSAQSASVVHLELHAPFAHLYFPQSCTSEAWQEPRPSQVWAVFIDVGPAHVDGPHTVVAG